VSHDRTTSLYFRGHDAESSIPCICSSHGESGTIPNMTRTPDGEQRARAAVQQTMGTRGFSNASLAREAGIDQGTVGEFLNGRRWPRADKLAAIEKALGLEVGAITRIAGDGEASAAGAWAPRTAPPTPEVGVQAAERLRHQLHPGLRRFTDDELVAEIRTRMLLVASLLHGYGEPVLVWRIGEDGGDELGSVPPG
jgi:transcriptional regulator with XRE-family HTH domain